MESRETYPPPDIGTEDQMKCESSNWCGLIVGNWKSRKWEMECISLASLWYNLYVENCSKKFGGASAPSSTHLSTALKKVHGRLDATSLLILFTNRARECISVQQLINWPCYSIASCQISGNLNGKISAILKICNLVWTLTHSLWSFRA